MHERNAENGPIKKYYLMIILLIEETTAVSRITETFDFVVFKWEFVVICNLISLNM